MLKTVYTVVCKNLLLFSVGNCKEPEPPFDGKVNCEDVSDLFSTRCNVTCKDGKKFLRPVPKIYTCGPIGLWNTESPVLKLKFPPCGGTWR